MLRCFSRRAIIRFHLSESGEEEVDYIPGVAKTRLANLPTMFQGTGRLILGGALDCIAWASKASHFLSTSFYELESPVLDALQSRLFAPAYCVGSTIQFFDGDGAAMWLISGGLTLSPEGRSCTSPSGASSRSPRLRRRRWRLGCKTVERGSCGWRM
ncbi:hypothetical protein NL676_028879 [Syzygium grande]|nr:hypothetical protein NL676_028879 [Syzygium grande]